MGTKTVETGIEALMAAYMLKGSGCALPEPGRNPCLVMKLLHTRHCLMTYNGGPYMCP